MRLPRRGECALSMTALSAASVGMTFCRRDVGLGFGVSGLAFRIECCERRDGVLRMRV